MELYFGVSEQIKPLQPIGQAAEFKFESKFEPLQVIWQSLPKAVPEDNRRFRGQNQWPSSWGRAPASVKLHVSIGKYWVSLYVLACMVVCIMERIGMYWHGMYYGMYWYVLFLVCITCIGKYWYVFRGHMCKYSYVLVSIGMYRKMVCIVHTGMYCYVLVYIDLY